MKPLKSVGLPHAIIKFNKQELYSSPEINLNLKMCFCLIQNMGLVHLLWFQHISRAFSWKAQGFILQNKLYNMGFLHLPYPYRIPWNGLPPQTSEKQQLSQKTERKKEKHSESLAITNQGSKHLSYPFSAITYLCIVSDTISFGSMIIHRDLVGADPVLKGLKKLRELK